MMADNDDTFFDLPAWAGTADLPGSPAPPGSGSGSASFTAPGQAPALALDFSRVAMYLELLARDGATYAADPSTARPQSLQDACFLLFVAAHEPACWTFPRGAGELPLRHDPYVFMSVAESWVKSVYSVKDAARALADAQALWDREHETAPIPVPKKTEPEATESLSSPALPTGSHGSAESSPVETSPAGLPLSGCDSGMHGAPSIATTCSAESPPSAMPNTTPG